MREIKKIVIAGAGTMGASMAQTFAKHGYEPTLYDLFPEALGKAEKLIAINQETEVSEGIVSKETSWELLRKIKYSEDMACLKDADFVVEAVVEDIDVKHKFWAEASLLAPPDAVLVSNTSGLSITRIAEAVENPKRFAGMHWINPPHLIPLIEVIKGEETSDECAGIVRDLALKVNKKPVIVKDAPGFVLNRIQLAILRECLHIERQGIASVSAIDDVMKYGLGLRYACLGPFEVADLGGLDVFDNIASYLFADLSSAGESFGLLKECAQNGRLGVKSGSGFYDYGGGRDEEVIRRRDQIITKLIRCLDVEIE